MSRTEQASRAGAAPFVQEGTSLSAPLHFAAALLDQQMWCWGCDVRRGEGNVLLHYGFRRWRPPAGMLGGTAYQLDLPARRQVVLRAFGLFFGAGEDGGLYLKRFTFAPQWCPSPDLRATLWRPEELPDLRRPETPEERTSAARLLSAALHWIAGYETWVVATLGQAYRRWCLTGWDRAVAEAEAVPGHWLRLAAASAALLGCEPLSLGEG